MSTRGEVSARQPHRSSCDELAADVPTVVAEMYRFVGVDPDFRPSEVWLLVGDYTDSMSSEDREYLRTYHAPDTQELEDVLGWDLSAWKR